MKNRASGENSGKLLFQTKSHLHMGTLDSDEDYVRGIVHELCCLKVFDHGGR